MFSNSPLFFFQKMQHFLISLMLSPLAYLAALGCFVLLGASFQRLMKWRFIFPRFIGTASRAERQVCDCAIRFPIYSALAVLSSMDAPFITADIQISGQNTEELADQTHAARFKCQRIPSARPELSFETERETKMCFMILLPQRILITIQIFNQKSLENYLKENFSFLLPSKGTLCLMHKHTRLIFNSFPREVLTCVNFSSLKGCVELRGNRSVIKYA